MDWIGNPIPRWQSNNPPKWIFNPNPIQKKRIGFFDFFQIHNPILPTSDYRHNTRESNWVIGWTRGSIHFERKLSGIIGTYSVKNCISSRVCPREIIVILFKTFYVNKLLCVTVLRQVNFRGELWHIARTNWSLKSDARTRMDTNEGR